MKHLLMLFLLCLPLISYTQSITVPTEQLVEFTSVYNSVKEENYGYAGIYLKEKNFNKGQSSYILRIYDNNLKQVNEQELIGPKNAMWRIDDFNGKNLAISVLMATASGLSVTYTLVKAYSYDLKTNKLYESEDYKYAYDSQSYKKIPEHAKLSFTRPALIDNTGYVITEYNPKDVGGGTSFTAYNNEFNKKLWTQKYESKNPKDIYSVAVINNEDLLFTEELYIKPDFYFIYNVLDPATGNIMYSINLGEDGTYRYEPTNMEITQDQVYIFGDLYSIKNKVRSGKSMGLFYRSYDKKTGKLIMDKKLNWSELGKVVEINEEGRVKGEGYMYFENYEFDKNGNIYAIGELYSNTAIPMAGSTFTVKDMFIIKFDKNFNPLYFKLYEKKKTSMPHNSINSGRSLADSFSYLFDYAYTESIPGKGIVVYYVDDDKNDNNKRGTFNSLSIKEDDSIVKDEFAITKKGGKIKVSRAKPGYFIVRETSKGESEIRLEKMNY